MGTKLFSELYHKDLEKEYANFKGIILDNTICDIGDLIKYFNDLHKNSKSDTKILISYYNHLWEPILKLASYLGFRKSVNDQNWLDRKDLENILYLTNFKVLRSYSRFFGLTNITITKPNKFKVNKVKNYSVSIIIPARNEAGNIKHITPAIPKFGKSIEFIFVEGSSTDNTWDEIKKLKNIIKLKQTGQGKKDAVLLGLSKAKGDILMIYDADRTVDANDLPKFYSALVHKKGDFANGSRMIYPMESQAMRTLNKIGNKFFSIIFTWILGQNFKDTLCGSKAFWKKDYKKFVFSNTDPFGDFDLIFGAIRNNLKVVEIPVRYKDRTYGSTNISRFKHGLLLLKMSFYAFFEFKLFLPRNTQ